MRSTDIYIAITTYDRPEELKALMEDISRETEGKKVHVHVYNDASKVSYAPTKGDDITIYGKNHGKQGYWSIMNDVFRDAETWKFKYFFFLQDDCRLCENFFDRAINEFEAIPDTAKATLCTFTPQSIYERVMWSNRKAEDIVSGNQTFLKSNYVDCIFMCPYQTLFELKFRMETIPHTRFTNELISSGVGQQLTLRLLRLRKTMYCAWSSLVNDHSNDSKMNKAERLKHPLMPFIREREEPIPLAEFLSSKREMVTVGIASIKSRIETLEKTVESLINQADHLHVYLNDYDHVPIFLQNNEKITWYMGTVNGDRGDTGKFFGLKTVYEGYFFSCDDDLIYPDDYIEKTIAFLKTMNNEVIVSYHGAILNPGHLENYYHNRKQIHYATFQRVPISVHIGGTGVMAFHIDTFKPDIKAFKYPNMADIWIGIQAQEQQIPIICAPRPLGWIKAEYYDDTIYGSKKNHDVQTDIINDFKKYKGEFIFHKTENMV